MRPKNPVRPKNPQPNQSSPVARDTAPDIVSWRPGTTSGHEPGNLPGHQTPEGAQPPGVHTPAVVITDLPPETHIRPILADLPISHYYLAPGLVERLPEPDPQTGWRSIVSGRKYVDLLEGGTVLLGTDAEGHFRAKSMTELMPSGPRLERVAGTPKWRKLQPASSVRDDSELIISRHRLPDDEPSPPGPSKRPRVDEQESSAQAEDPAAPGRSGVGDSAPPPHTRLPGSAAEPWMNWGIAAHHASPEDVTIGGVLYSTVPRGALPDDPIVYIKNPAHLVYDFDLLQSTLRRDLDQQPRGAIKVPPSQRWEIDPNLPFDKAFTDQVATYFPELTDISLLNVAREQFRRANGSDNATGVGLTTLRQVFNDWTTSRPTPRPELTDPLLMLPITPMSASQGNARKLELPVLSDPAPLQRLEFAAHKFREQWHYFLTTQTGVELKRFMANLLKRNGYIVFDPTNATSYPALVFRRAGHDFVFYMSLHRVRGKNIHVPSASDPGLAPGRLLERIGHPAMQAVENAKAAGKLIWLKGGSQVAVGQPDAAFIVRIDDGSL
jgi:hypothetical protein